MAKVKEKKETKKVVKKVTNKEVKKVEDTKKTNEKDIKIIKRNGNKQEFDSSKIIAAISKSAERVMVKLTPEAEQEVVELVLDFLMN